MTTMQTVKKALGNTAVIAAMLVGMGTIAFGFWMGIDAWKLALGG